MIFSSKKSRFLAGWEIDFNNPDELKKILLTQGIDKKGFKYFGSVQTATELEIKNNQILKAIQHSAGSKEIEEIDIELPISDWPDRKTFFLAKDSKGKHKIGGECPSDFVLPNCDNLKTPFIYIASIDTTDKNFDWIKLPRLDVAYPLYECNFGIFIDYSNPLNPKILNPDTFDDSWYDNSTKGINKVKFVEQRFSSVDMIDDFEDEESILCGVPLWYQAPEIPICPKTGEIMRFVCTINSDSKIELKDKNGIENLPFADYLIFADYGNLFVFYQPDSKVLSLKIQF